MPKWLRRYLVSDSLNTHLRRALVAGLVARVACAIFVYGPQALDDYKHGVWPAYQFYAGEALDLPNYRSHLLTWTLALAPKLAAVFGVRSALGQVRAMYLELALISLLGIVGAYVFARRERSRLWGRTALYLTALHPLMPFVSTRAFGEAVAMSFAALGFGLLPTFAFAGFLSLGIATLFRFHAGILFVAAAAVYAYRKHWSVVGRALLAGLCTLGLEAGIDWLSGKSAFETLITYLAENDGGGARYGVSPWYNPWVFVLAISFAPFSLALVGRVRGLARRHGGILWPWLLFVLAHSVAAHKEERFLYPILALELWSLAYLWAAAARVNIVRTVFARVLMTGGAVGLLVACFVNTQAGEIEPPALIEARYPNVIYLDHESLFQASRFQFYFLRPPSELKAVAESEFSATRVDDELGRDPGRRAVAMLTSREGARDQLRALAGVRTTRARCGDVERSGSLIDRVLYALNPRHNQRRRPTWYLVCERT